MTTTIGSWYCQTVRVILWTSNATWWRHQMETFSALLALCARNSPVTGEFPAQGPVTRSFDIFFDLRLNKRLRNNHEAGDLSRHRVHYDVTVYMRQGSRSSWIQIAACRLSGHYLNQCWCIINWTIGNKFRQNFNWYTKKIHSKMSSVKWQQFCLGRNVLSKSQSHYFVICIPLSFPSLQLWSSIYHNCCCYPVISLGMGSAN